MHPQQLLEFSAAADAAAKEAAAEAAKAAGTEAAKGAAEGGISAADAWMTLEAMDAARDMMGPDEESAAPMPSAPKGIKDPPEVVA